MRFDQWNKSFALLHVDDSDAERAMVRKAISLTEVPFLFYGASCIEEAVPYFESTTRHDEEHPRPALVLLDYDLARHTGVDFLYWLRTMKKIKSVPVVMFSGSSGRHSVAECYATGANYFLSKPKSLVRLKIIIGTLYLSLLPYHGSCPILALQEYQPDPRKRNGPREAELKHRGFS